MKTVPIELTKWNDVLDKEVIRYTKFHTLNAKVNNLEKKIPDSTTLIQINQYNPDKQKKVG